MDIYKNVAKVNLTKKNTNKQKKSKRKEKLKLKLKKKKFVQSIYVLLY